MPRIRMRALTGKLQQLRRALVSLYNDFRPVWLEQTPIIQATAAEKLRAGSGYAPITAATRQWRRRRGYSPANPPLQASGKLVNSLLGGEGSIVVSDRKTLEVGTRLPEAAPNQFGAQIIRRYKSEKQQESGKGRKSKRVLYSFFIPARPFMPSTQDETFLGKLSRQLESFLNRYVLSKINEGGNSPTEESII